MDDPRQEIPNLFGTGSIFRLCFEFPHIERSRGVYIGIEHRLLHPKKRTF